MHKRIDLRFRSAEKELLDEDNISFAEIEQNMQELNVINTWLGGHAITIAGFKKLLGSSKKVHVCEIGCGNGNNLGRLYRWCRSRNIDFRCTGIDIKDTCVEAARRGAGITNANWITSDYEAVQFAERPDIIFSSLFCHHFSSEALTQQLKWMQQNTGTGFFINDLQRHVLAYQSIKAITKIFGASRLVAHDAPVSVARGFHKKEWAAIFEQAGISHFSIEWKWAFRYLIIYKHANRV